MTAEFHHGVDTPYTSRRVLCHPLMLLIAWCVMNVLDHVAAVIIGNLSTVVFDEIFPIARKFIGSHFSQSNHDVCSLALYAIVVAEVLSSLRLPASCFARLGYTPTMEYL